MAVAIRQEDGGDLEVKLEDWTVELRLIQEFRGLRGARFREAVQGKRKVWAYKVTGPLFPFGEEGSERTRAAAWEAALRLVPQGIVLRHWHDLPVVPGG